MRNRLAPIVFSSTALAVLLVVVYVVALSGGDGADASATTAPTAGCVEVVSQELYVQHAYACPDGTRVVTFATDDARDAYLKVAEGFGTVTVERGSAWARIR